MVAADSGAKKASHPQNHLPKGALLALEAAFSTSSGPHTLMGSKKASWFNLLTSLEALHVSCFVSKSTLHPLKEVDS